MSKFNTFRAVIHGERFKNIAIYRYSCMEICSMTIMIVKNFNIFLFFFAPFRWARRFILRNI